MAFRDWESLMVVWTPFLAKFMTGGGADRENEAFSGLRLKIRLIKLATSLVGPACFSISCRINPMPRRPIRLSRRTRSPQIQRLAERHLLAADVSGLDVFEEELSGVERAAGQGYFSRAIPAAAIVGTQKVAPAGGTRPIVDRNDGFRIEIVPGLNLRNQFGALEAVKRAAQQWEAMLADPITVSIHIDIAFNPGFARDEFPASVLGLAQPVEVELPYAQVRHALQSDGLLEQDDSILAFLPSPESIKFAYPGSLRYDNMISLTKPNLKSLGLHTEQFDEELGVSDGLIVLNPEASAPNQEHRFDYNSADGISPSKYDFESLVVHEIGHVLGFISAVDRIDQADPASGIAIAPSTLDLFRFRSLPGPGNPRTAAAFETIQRELRPSLPAVVDFVINDGWATLENEYPVELGESTPRSGFGHQASHWQSDDLFAAPIGVMAPTLALQTVTPISNVDLRAFDLIGYDILPPGEASDAPILQDDAVTLTSSRTIAIDALANDQNNSRPLNLASVRIIESPAGGTVEFDPVTGFFVYSADSGFFGEDTFTYTVADDRGIFAAPAVVAIDVAGSSVGQSPVAIDDFVVARQNRSTVFNPLANDGDPDSVLSFERLQVTSPPSNGTVTRQNDRLVYTPDSDFVGDDALSYSIIDADGNVASAVIRVTVGATLPPIVIPGVPLELTQRSDVNGDQRITAIDALMVINFLNRGGTIIPTMDEADSVHDVNQDGQVTALDALSIINLLNRQSAFEAIGPVGIQEADDDENGAEPFRQESVLF
jgi:hypothetical protein